MQSCNPLKKFHDYDLGSVVYEGDVYMGVVSSMELHPSDSTCGYLLVLKPNGEYVIYVCLVFAICGVMITRRLPASVLIAFGKVVSDGGSYKPISPIIKKYPVVDIPVVDIPIVDIPEEIKDVELEPEQDIEDDMLLESPYFDFV